MADAGGFREVEGETVTHFTEKFHRILERSAWAQRRETGQSKRPKSHQDSRPRPGRLSKQGVTATTVPFPHGM